MKQSCMIGKVASAPTLEGSLRGALLARLPRLPASAVPADTFGPAARAFATADDRYRTTIRTSLASRSAREILAATDLFRARVGALRAAGAAEAARLAPGAEFDLLDVATPRAAGLSHVAIVRLADVSDRARGEVAALRGDANERIAPLLTEKTQPLLIAAKRARVVAFRGAVHAALVPFGPQIERFSETVEALAALADGWY